MSQRKEPTLNQILNNAKKLRALYERIHETVKYRDNSLSKFTEWEAACSEFHSRFGELRFPNGCEGWLAFYAGTPEGVRLAVLFLEADQYTFRSGYHKQIVWQRLKRLPLNPEQQRRLENVAIHYLNKRISREFWYMAKFVRLRGTAEFWQNVENLATGNSSQPEAIKARWLLLVRMNKPVRRWIGRELFRPKYQSGYIPCLDFPLTTESP